MMEEEEPGTPHFQRLISDESVSSLQSSDSCEYHHTEIYAQLPSSQAHRQQQHDLHPEDERRMLESCVPPQALLVCMKIKRHIRSERAERWQQKHPAGSWDSWRQKQQITRRRLKEHISEALSGLLLWRHTLHKIEGGFGVGVKAYFVFLRYLLCLNVLYCVIIGGSVLTPTLMYREKPVSEQTFGFKDIFIGSGFLEGSPVFHSFYTRGSLDLPCFNTPVLFLLGMISVLLLSIIMVVRRTVVGYKHMWLTGTHFSSNVSYKVFCGWDFCIQNEKAAALKQTFISNELKMDLEEKKFHEDIQKRTIKRWIQLILLRVVLNIFVLLLLAGSFILIHYTITVSHHQENQKLDWISSLMLEYLSPVTMTTVNYLLPHIFRETSEFEDYSPATQLNLTLIRSIFLKLASLGIYLFFFIQSLAHQSQHKCVENTFGKEMYKLTVFNFLESFFSAFCVAYPRMLLVKRCAWLKQKLGMPQFDISSNVLDLVNSQTVTWVGVFYCPLLPAISAVRLLLLLYIKKFTLIHCCVRAQRMFRVASSSVLFHFTLMLGLFLSVIVLGVNINMFVPGRCGPFEGDRSVFNVTAECVETLPAPAQTAISYVTSKTFAFALVLAEIVILTSYTSRGRANSKAIERWKEMLVMCSSDKRFLAKKHNTMRRQKTTRYKHVQQCSTDA